MSLAVFSFKRALLLVDFFSLSRELSFVLALIQSENFFVYTCKKRLLLVAFLSVCCCNECRLNGIYKFAGRSYSVIRFSVFLCDASLRSFPVDYFSPVTLHLLFYYTIFFSFVLCRPRVSACRCALFACHHFSLPIRFTYTDIIKYIFPCIIVFRAAFEVNKMRSDGTANADAKNFAG